MKSKIEKEITKSIDKKEEQHYVCPECGTSHVLSELIAEDNGWDYTYRCRNCRDIMEANGEYFW